MAFWHTRNQLAARNTIEHLPAQRFIKELEDGITINFEETAAGTVLSSGNINSSTLLGWPVLAVGDTWSTLWRIPSNCELDGSKYDIWIYPICFVDAAAETGDLSTWTLQYTAYNGSTTALIAPAVVTGVADGTLSWAADDALTRAQLGIKLDLSLATTIVDGTTQYLVLDIECDAVTDMTVTELTFMGADIVYNVPQT